MKIDLKAITINQCWQGRRFKAPKYTQWRKDAVLLLSQHKKYKEEIEYELTINVYTRHASTSDTDNFIKPIQDALVEAGIIPDDKYIKRVICEKFKSKEDYFEYYISSL